MVELSLKTRAHVAAMHRTADVPIVERLLADDCAESVPLLGVERTPTTLERMRFAVLRIADGDLDRLRQALGVAHQDWRDVLVAAGFSADAEAHLQWVPRRIAEAERVEWMAGKAPDGVDFHLNDAVEVVRGLSAGAKGCVISLLGLEPEPRYLVELSSGSDIEVYQRQLRAAG